DLLPAHAGRGLVRLFDHAPALVVGLLGVLLLVLAPAVHPPRDGHPVLVACQDEPRRPLRHAAAPDQLAWRLGVLVLVFGGARPALLELPLLGYLLAAGRGQQRSLVGEVREVGTGEAGSSRSKRVEIDLRCARLALRVHLEDLAPAVAVGAIDDDLPVEAART